MNTPTTHIKTEKQLVPQLRFAEFESAWIRSTIGEVCSMKAGSYMKASQISDDKLEGMFPCYGGNGLRGYTKSFNKNGKFTLIGRQGAHCGNVKLVDGKFHATEHAVVVSLNNQYSTDWIYYLLYISNLNQYATGQAQPGLSVKGLENVGIIVPSLPEQQKIASFLTAVDTKLQQLTSKKELLQQYKKGVMQQLFSQQLRFKKADGSDYEDWEEKKLRDVFDEHKTKNIDGSVTEVFSVAKEKGVINQIEHLGRSYAADSTLHYKVAFPGDLIYTKSPTKDFPFGIIKQNLTGRKGLVSPLYVVTKPQTNSLGFIFHCYFLSWVNVYNYLVPLVQKGAKNTMNINNDDFLNGAIFMLPVSEEEQQQIASYLAALDTKIETVTQQIKKTQAFKKGLLQQMFV